MNKLESTRGLRKLDPQTQVMLNEIDGQLAKITASLKRIEKAHELAKARPVRILADRQPSFEELSAAMQGCPRPRSSSAN
jgi:hypothetical protein